MITKCPRLSVRATLSSGVVVNAVSDRLAYSPTSMPLIGSRLLASITLPDTSNVSMRSPVEKL